MFGSFTQGNVLTHKENFPMSVQEEIFSKWLTTWRLWPPRSPDLNTCIITWRRQWKIDSVYMKIHIHCKNWKKIFESKLSVFQDKNLLWVEIYFPKLQGLLRSWKSALLRLFWEIRHDNWWGKEWTLSCLRKQAVRATKLPCSETWLVRCCVQTIF